MKSYPGPQKPFVSSFFHSDELISTFVGRFWMYLGSHGVPGGGPGGSPYFRFLGFGSVRLGLGACAGMPPCGPCPMLSDPWQGSLHVRHKAETKVVQVRRLLGLVAPTDEAAAMPLELGHGREHRRVLLH